MNCPTCGRLAFYHAKQCICGTLLAWPAPPVTTPRPMHPAIALRLRELGFERRPDENPTEFAERCRQYILDRHLRQKGKAA